MASAAAASSGEPAPPPAAAATDAALQAAAFKCLYPEQYFARFVSEGLRPDGRGLTTARPVSIGTHAVSAADGSALVKVGATTVLAGCRLEVMIPDEAAPDCGRLVVNAELTALCSGDWRPGRQSPEAHVLAARVSDLLLSCGILDTRQLCISPGAAVWVLYLDVYVLDAAGGLLDAALLAALAALRDCCLPLVHLTAEGNVERGPDPDESEEDGDGDAAMGAAAAREAGEAGRGRLLVLGGAPVCLTCGIYKGNVIVDPDHEEAALMSGRVSVAVDGDGVLLGEGRGGAAAAAVAAVGLV